ncbi:helix-turn-helix transcriptional regulator [Streptomyces sp. NPDC088719]|uniref:helix-turn-helix transcriptional regulator n=1 Tax=Streptomyces sp. NPDC088719 TaxID=3365872 RepID=UPI00380C940D
MVNGVAQAAVKCCLRRSVAGIVSATAWALSPGHPLVRGIPLRARHDGITGTQLASAHLLVEGHVDEAIARRLGMKVRTCRGQIANLSVVLGSGSRAQLGYLRARSGILDNRTADPAD